jgi:hypothetical protein
MMVFWDFSTVKHNIGFSVTEKSAVSIFRVTEPGSGEYIHQRNVYRKVSFYAISFVAISH